MPQYAVDFFFTEHARKSAFGLGAKDVENMPVVLEHIDIEKPDPAITDSHGVGGPFADIFSMEEIFLEFLL